jgi:hypothetical protein
MPSTAEAIEAAIDEAIAPGFRGNLVARGQARAMIWRDGALPAGAPGFSPQLSNDLHGYAYSLLGLGLRLIDLGGDRNRARLAFERAATALESIIARGETGSSDREFHFVMAAASYHLARLSARAFSLLAIVRSESNFSPIERALALLMLRELDALEELALNFRLAGSGSDQSVAALLATADELQEEVDPDADDEGAILFDAVDRSLTDRFFAAVATFLLALERGDSSLAEEAVKILIEGVVSAGELNMVPQWWVHRIAIHLFRDLWSASFHEVLPLTPSGDAAEGWVELRSLFLALLHRRARAEIELWPSQTEAASRSVAQTDDLVVSLPTSAGKTRIAELCILRCLASGKRVVFVTPLRALSAQTEATLHRTFGPLGKTISALYGSAGVTRVDEDAIRERNIVVATPEKLDFALRNDPSLLDDVGLLVFDEGHMIGLSEREVRYEVQIQRLLKRLDAASRRIVCLSAILPDGDQLEDFSNWLRRDQPGGVVRSAWRPTRLRFAELHWNGSSGLLNLRVDGERPFVPNFIVGKVPPVGKRRKVFPSDLGELCLATAWRLIDDGQTVLIFCPVRAHVEPFAARILDLHERGALPSLLEVDEAKLQTAITLGAEWLGEKHPLLRCLKLGVAIHHGALPSPYRKEIERLLREGVLRVTISSPTLAQGLNLSATAVIMHSLTRNRARIETAEFKNVIGRAGRAYVDVEGLVLYPIFNNHGYRVAQWNELIADVSTREMESGLLRLVLALLLRMEEQTKRPLDQLAEYVLNNAGAWAFPEIASEEAEHAANQQRLWEGYIASLDTAILALLGDLEVEDGGIEKALDEVLQSSLWERRLSRRKVAEATALKAGLIGRARVVWAQSTALKRRGYFLAGIGLGTGHALDALAETLNDLLTTANSALATNCEDQAIKAITAIAEHVFAIFPFQPENLPANWRCILSRWLKGEALATLAEGDEGALLQFVEGALVYRLPWAMEAIRVRGLANNDHVDLAEMKFALSDFDLSYAVPAVETGTMNRAAAVLMQAGFNSRLAAIKAVRDTNAAFVNIAGLRDWLQSEEVKAVSAHPDWPTSETARLWTSFVADFAPPAERTWSQRRYRSQVAWAAGFHPVAGIPLRLTHVENVASIMDAAGNVVGKLLAPLNPERKGLALAQALNEVDQVLIIYLGPNDIWLN